MAQYSTLWHAGAKARAVGDNEKASKLYQQMKQVIEQALRETPHSPVWQRELSAYHINLGDIQQEQGDGAGALQNYRTSLMMGQKLAAQDPGNALLQLDLAKSQLKAASTETNASVKNKLIGQALTSLKALRRAGKLNADHQEWLAELEKHL